MKDKSTPAFILGLFETGLGVIRSLGREGINVFGYDHKKDIAYYSKYAKTKICPNPLLEEKTFIDFIIDEASKFNKKPVLFFTSDYFMPSIVNNLDIIKENFLINLPNSSLLSKINNKYEQFLLAMKNVIPVPKTTLIKNDNDINEVLDSFSFPIFVKGVDSNTWRSVFGNSKKGFYFSDKQSFSNEIINLTTNDVELIVQEFIEGTDNDYFKYNIYVDKDGIIRAGFCLRKIRQNPINFGIGCLVESINYDELMKLGNKLFAGISYMGIGSAEFKLDKKDNKLKLIELNPRYWQQNILSTVSGINFPIIQYSDLTNQLSNSSFTYKPNIKWINIYSDFDSFLKYRKFGTLKLRSWFRSLRGKKVYSDFAKDDVLPAFFELRFGKRLINLPRYLWRNL